MICDYKWLSIVEENRFSLILVRETKTLFDQNIVSISS